MPMPRDDVFTLLNHGTKSHRSRTDGEIIADFGRNMDGEEYEDFLITDGPGSGWMGVKKAPKSARTAHLMPGDFDPFDRLKGRKKSAPAYSKTPFLTIEDITSQTPEPSFFSPSGHSTLRGVVGHSTQAAITGHGWDDNIRHAIATLATVFPNLTGTVNMIGWSRGAVTCLRMANWMKEFLGTGLRVNIFAIDPVAGLDAGLRLKDTYTIADNVDSYVGILALDEARGDFAPQDLSRIRIEDPITTNVAFLPFPGVHNTPVLLKNSRLPEVTRMVRFLGWKFLKKLKTHFLRDETVYSLVQQCEMYANMLLKREAYKALMKKTFMAKQSGGIVERALRLNRAQYVYGDLHFFINEHHRACFKAAFPDIYEYFFTTSIPSYGAVYKSYDPASRWGMAFQQFYQSAPTSFDALAGIFIFERVSSLDMRARPYWRVSAPGVGATTTVPEPPGVRQIMNLLVT
jgi:hypothetical protein